MNKYIYFLLTKVIRPSGESSQQQQPDESNVHQHRMTSTHYQHTENVQGVCGRRCVTVWCISFFYYLHLILVGNSSHFHFRHRQYKVFESWMYACFNILIFHSVLLNSVNWMLFETRLHFRATQIGYLKRKKTSFIRLALRIPINIPH